MKRAKIRVFGIVQGVGYRSFVYGVARRLGLKGYVKNLEDGSVLVVVEGEENAIEKLVDALHRGPPAAIVERIDVEYEEPKGEFITFYIDYDC